VVVDAIQGNLPNSTAMIGVGLVILGVAIVNLPSAEAHLVEPQPTGTADPQSDAKRVIVPGS
jgi:hypothetical protein